MVDRRKIMFKFLFFLSLMNCMCDGTENPMKVCKHIPKKKIDKAFLTVEIKAIDDQNVTVILKTISTECYTCDLQLRAVIEPGYNSCTVLVDTRWKMRVSVVSNITTSSTCSEENLSGWFLDGGNYSIMVIINDHISCRKPMSLNTPMDSYIPIYIAIGSFVGLIMLWWLAKYIYRNHLFRKMQNCLLPDSASFVDPVALNKERNWFGLDVKTDMHSNQVKQLNLRRRKYHKPDSSLAPKKVAETRYIYENDDLQGEYAEQDLGVPTNVAEEDHTRRLRKERLKSLDTFRGISIVAMIFVNYRGGDYWFFRHSKWNGITVADLVFPWFVWIMGTAMAYSFHGQLRRCTPKTKMFWKIFKRSCILFALGLLINSSDSLNPVNLKEFRIPGVLQRFAGTYLIIATLHMFFAKPNDPNQYTWWSPIRDITDYFIEWIVNIILVIVWLALTFGLYVPGCPRGYLGPGGLANDILGRNVSLCTGGAASYIDRMVFGEGRIYQHPTCKEIYDTSVPHDPEGLLGTLTSCFMCFLGLQAGKILRMFPDWKARVKRFLIWAVCLGIIAAILCKGEKNGGFIPINKNLWSLSFVMCMSCFAFFLLAFCYITVDVYRVWSGAPFYYPGMNAILLYLGHEIFNQPLRTFLGIQPKSHMVYLPINILDTAFWVILSYYLYYKEIFFSV